MLRNRSGGGIQIDKDALTVIDDMCAIKQNMGTYMIRRLNLDTREQMKEHLTKVKR